MGDAGTVILTDQATFCLASGHTYCPRYRAALGAGDEQMGAGSAGTDSLAEPLASDWLSANLGELDQGLADLADDSAAERRMWGWLGAGLLFLMVFLCGSTFAVYLGWQTVSSTIRATQGQQTASQSPQSRARSPAPDRHHRDAGDRSQRHCPGGSRADCATHTNV